MPVPIPTPIFRLVHVDNLRACVRRGGLHAPNCTPNDGLAYKTIHNVDVQAKRRARKIGCGPGGGIHDYVSFYFGYLSPMLLNLKTGRVPGYNEGQVPLAYLVSTCQAVKESSARFIFSDGHGIAAITEWYDDLEELVKVDWDVVFRRYWMDSVDDMDRMRRKQAEFLVHRFCDWSLIQEIGVINNAMKARVEEILAGFPEHPQPPVRVRAGWYFY